jgi:uncharacterized repeat protein (TIGR01451 family)
VEIFSWPHIECVLADPDGVAVYACAVGIPATGVDFKMRNATVCRQYSLWLPLFLFLARAAFAATELEFQDAVTDLTPDAGSSADKARILSLGDGTQLVAWHEGVGSADRAWDLWGSAYAPRDIFVSLSVDRGVTWSDPLNVSNTAGLTDPGALYDRVGDGTGLAPYYGDSGKANLFAVGNTVVVAWNDSYCGDGLHGPATYAGEAGLIELPYRCLYAARLVVADGSVEIVGVDRITDAARDVTNEVARGTGAGYALAWQEDPNGLQLGEARGEGDGASGARVSPGTDIWYAWLPSGSFSNPDALWQGPVPISDNYDYVTGAATGGGASRPLMAMAGSPPTVIMVYEESKNAGPADPGKYVRYHYFRANQAPPPDAGIVISAPAENARRARVMAMASSGPAEGTRMLLMWRQGEGIQGAPADFMMRIGYVPAGVTLGDVPDAGFRPGDLRPAVDPLEPANNAPGLNLSGTNLDDPTAADPLANAKAHRAVMDGDFIYAGYTLDPNATDGIDEYQYMLRWSADGGHNWSAPANVSAGIQGSENVIEPRLLRTPGTVPSGNPEDVRNPDIYLLAWGSLVPAPDGLEPIRDALFVTRTVDRGLSFERVQKLASTRTSPDQTDEQIQLRVTPDGENVAAVWIRRDQGASDVMYASAVGITPTAELSITAVATSAAPDIGDTITVTIEIENAGPQTATELGLTASADAGLAIRAAASANGDCALVAAVSCDLDDLAPGGIAMIELEVEAVAAGQWAVTGTTTAWEQDTQPADNQFELTVTPIPKADLGVAISTAAASVVKGDRFDVSFEIQNNGPQPATSLRFVMLLPPGLEVISAAPCALANGDIACNLQSLPVGEPLRGTATLSARTSGAASISATATADEIDPDMANNNARLSLVIDRPDGGGCVYDPRGGNDGTLVFLLLLGMGLRMAGSLRATPAPVQP